MTEAPPRIAFVGWLFGSYGGMETRIVAAAELARDAGFDVTIQTARPAPPGSLTAQRLAPFGARSVIGEWQRTPRARAVRAAARLATLARTRRRLTEAERERAGDGRARRQTHGFWDRAGRSVVEQADVVHLFGPPHAFMVEALEAAHASGAATVYQSVHTVTAVYASIRPRFIGTSNLLDLILTSSPSQAADFAEHFDYQGPTAVVQQWAYDVEAELLALPLPPEAPGTVTVGALCRLDAVKGLDVLIQALAAAAAEQPHLRLRIGGTGDEEQALRDLAQSLGVSDRVELTGFVADRVSFYRGLDAFAITSRAEGGPVTGVEAMAAGRAIISSPVGAMPERLAGGAGLIVEVGDVEGTARALIEVAADPATRRRLGAAVRERYRTDYSAASQSALLVDTWSHLAERSRRRRARS